VAVASAGGVGQERRGEARQRGTMEKRKEGYACRVEKSWLGKSIKTKKRNSKAVETRVEFGGKMGKS